MLMYSGYRFVALVHGHVPAEWAAGIHLSLLPPTERRTRQTAEPHRAGTDVPHRTGTDEPHPEETDEPHRTGTNESRQGETDEPHRARTDGRSEAAEREAWGREVRGDDKDDDKDVRPCVDEVVCRCVHVSVAEEQELEDHFAPAIQHYLANTTCCQNYSPPTMLMQALL